MSGAEHMRDFFLNSDFLGPTGVGAAVLGFVRRIVKRLRDEYAELELKLDHILTHSRNADEALNGTQN